VTTVPTEARQRTEQSVPRESYRDTVRRLAAAQKKVAPGAPAYSILVNRRVGRLLAAGAFRRGMTPNAVTGVSAVFTGAGIVMIATVPPAWWSGCAVWLALALGYALDSADGQVARLRGGGSLSGEWLDHVVDSVKIVTLHLAVLVSMYRFAELPDDRWLLVPLLFAAVGSVAFFAMTLNDQLKRVYVASSGLTVRAGASSLRRQLLVLPTDYGILCLAFVLLGAPRIFFVGYTVIFAASAGHLTLALLKWHRDMGRLDQAVRAAGNGEVAR